MSASERQEFPLNEVREHTGLPSKQVQALPFYGMLPKDPIGLLRWRIYVRERCLTDHDFREDILAMCEQDILFWASTFVCVFEPRGKPRMIPILLWEDQADVITWMWECFGVRDCGVEKSRGIGCSWNIAILFYWAWYFWPNCHMAMISWATKYLDQQNNPGTLMGKLDWIHKHLPAWMTLMPNGEDILHRTYSGHYFGSRMIGSTIVGFEPNVDVLSGDRKTAVAFDEVAKFPLNVQDALISMQYVSDSRYMISTMREGSPRFFSLMRKEDSDMLRIRAYWWNNKDRSRGKYKMVRGRVIHLDPEYDWSQRPNYKFNHPYPQEDLIRSPWVDAELRRAGNKDIHSALVELYGILAMVNSRLFQEDALERMQPTVRSPYARGFIDYNLGEWKAFWEPNESGNTKIWKTVGADGRLSAGGPYALGCDPAGGSGTQESNNAAMQVIDILTGEQVLEFADNKFDPVAFAQLAYTTAKWLAGDRGQGWVLVNFESNGSSGGSFKKELERLCWHNVMVRDQESAIFKKKTKLVGYHNADGGIGILLELQRAMRQDEISVRSEDVLDECRAYAFAEDGYTLLFESVEVARGRTTGRSHGDRAMALAIAWQARQDRRPTVHLEGDAPEEDLTERLTGGYRPKRSLRDWGIPSVLRR